jgi:hypothetical protein
MRSKFDFLPPGSFSKKFTHEDLPVFLDRATGDVQKYFTNICTLCSEMIDSVCKPSYTPTFLFACSLFSLLSFPSSSSLTLAKVYSQYILFSSARLSRRQTLSWSVFQANIIWFIRILQFFGALCELALYPDLVASQPGIKRDTKKFSKALQTIVFSCLGYIASCLSGESRAYKPAIAAFINVVGPPDLRWEAELLVCLKVNVRAATCGKLGELILTLLEEEGRSFESSMLTEIVGLVAERKQTLNALSESK